MRRIDRRAFLKLASLASVGAACRRRGAGGADAPPPAPAPRDRAAVGADAAGDWGAAAPVATRPPGPADAGAERAEPTSEAVDVVIVGGGLAGLMAAWELRDRSILLLEKAPSLGGRIRTGEWEGLRYSLGAAYLGPPSEEERALFSSLGLEAVPIPGSADAIASGGKFYPDELPGDQEMRQVRADYARVARELNRWNEQGIEEAIYGGELEALAAFEELDRESIGAWLGRERIHPLVRRYIDSENRGLFGAANDDLSLLFDIPEMAYNLGGGIIEEGALDAPPPSPIEPFQPGLPATPSGDVYTFRDGMMELVWAIQSRSGLGDRLRAGAEVRSVTVEADGTVVTQFTLEGRARAVRSRAAILATPAPVTAAIVQGVFSAELRAALEAVRYTSYVTLALHLDRRLMNCGWNVACLDGDFTTINDGSRMVVPLDHTGKSILGVALPPPRASDRSRLSLGDDEIVQRTLAGLEAYFPEIRKHVLGREISRFEHAFPVFAPGCGEALWVLNTDRSAEGPLFLAGDYMVYPTLGGAAMSAEKALNRLERWTERA